MLGRQVAFLAPRRQGPIVDGITRQNGAQKGCQRLGDVILGWRSAENLNEAMAGDIVVRQNSNQAAPNVLMQAAVANHVFVIQLTNQNLLEGLDAAIPELVLVVNAVEQAGGVVFSTVFVEGIIIAKSMFGVVARGTGMF